MSKAEVRILLYLLFWPFVLAWALIKRIWPLIKAINSHNKNVSEVSDETKQISIEANHRDFNYGGWKNNNYLESKIKLKSDFNPNLLKKGEEFEDFVITLFNEYFEIMPRTEPYPDYKIKFNPTREIFVIECKWKKSLSENSFNIENRQLKNYKDYKIQKIYLFS